MSKLTARALREHLRNKPHDILVEEIVSLSSRNDAVREYFAAQLGLGPQPTLTLVRANIRASMRQAARA
jgi:hypothetical protein